MRLLPAFAAAAAISAAVPAHAVVITDTGATLGSTDSNWSVMWRGLLPGATSNGALPNAPIVTSIPSPPWQPNSATNHWLGVNSTATIAGASGDGSHRYEYAFTTSIDLAVAQLVTRAPSVGTISSSAASSTALSTRPRGPIRPARDS